MGGYMTTIDDKVLIKISEAEEKFKIPASTIYEKVREGLLSKFIDQEKTTLIDKSEFLKTFKPAIISVYNKKGGVGKSTISTILADYFHKRGVSVLLCDFDSQCNLTDTWIGYKDRIESKTLYNFMEDNTSLHKIVKSCTYANGEVSKVSLLPASDLLENKEYLDTTVIKKFKKPLYDFFEKYQVVIIDCPPSVNALTRLALLIANYVLIPVQSEPYAYDGMDTLLSKLMNVAELNSDFIDYRVLVSMHRGARTIIREDVYDALNSKIGQKLFNYKINDFIGFLERSRVQMNVFDTNGNDKAIQEINLLFDDIYRMIYLERDR
jgi:chromosome partitioning protein